MRHLDVHQSRAINELCSLVLAVLRPPSDARRFRQKASPAAIASLLLGASLAMMLCGSVTFVIGFVLMPWVLWMVMVLYFCGIVSSLSGLGRSVVCSASGIGGSSVDSPSKVSCCQTFPVFNPETSI